LATAFITYLTTPIARYAALRFGFMAKVRDRDVHDRPIPRLGGLAMVAGLLAGLSLASQLPLISNVFKDGSQIRALLAGAGILVLLGVIDDKWSIDGPVKLAGQTLAAAVMASQGISLIWLPLPFVQGTLSLDPLTGVLLTVLIVLITVNAVNFVDGLDGLAAGVVGLWFFKSNFAHTNFSIIGGNDFRIFTAQYVSGPSIYGRYRFHAYRLNVGSLRYYFDWSNRSWCAGINFSITELFTYSFTFSCNCSAII
jgi:hypothetical protein